MGTNFVLDRTSNCNGSQLFSNSKNPKKLDVQSTFNVKNPLILDVESMFNVKNPKKLDFWIFVGLCIRTKKINPIQ
jgi:hypothetical protein